MYKILVIEDNTDVRENMAEILALAGYDVLTAPDGKQGVEVAFKEIPDLVVCDIMMPLLDGYGVLHLLNKNPDTAGTPFIFSTAKSEKADLRKGMEMGADDYLTKPFEGSELLDAVEIRLKKTASVKKRLLEKLEHINLGPTEDTTRQLVSDQHEQYSHPKKTLLYREGQKPKALYYLLTGKVKNYLTHGDGKELITGITTPGHFFGYLPILEKTNYKDSAQALEECTVMHIPVEEFLGLTTSDTKTSSNFIKLLANDIFEKEEMLLNMAYSTLRKKVAYGLIMANEKFRETENGVPVIMLSRENLANSIGIATESLIRTLADFKAEKLIHIEGQSIRLLQEEKLKNLPY